jgi:hypothetical protein
MNSQGRSYRLGDCLFEATTPSGPMLAPEPGADQPSAPEVDLRPYCTPVENQLNVGSCAANAMVGAVEYQLRIATGQTINLSRLFVYYNARQLANKQADDCGTFITHVMASMLAHGACLEETWPYIEANWPLKPPQVCYNEAMSLSIGQSQLQRGIQYARVPHGPYALTAVAAGIPIVFGASLPDAFFKAADRTGRMPSIREAGTPSSDGGHAMLIVGFSLADNSWIVRNSWGPDWGDQGHFRVPFDTLGHYSHPDQYWAVGTQDQFAAAKMAVRGVSQALAAQQTTAQAPQQAEDALSRLKGGLRSRINEDLSSAKKGFRDRLRGPGAGGGY